MLVYILLEGLIFEKITAKILPKAKSSIIVKT